MRSDAPTLEFVESDADAGFRLERVEVLNWGTFDRRIWTLQLNGHNTLLTGDIGSGKSTLVDAVTTLLVPAHRVAYNKAAGAEGRERTLRSYVLGHYKSGRSDVGGTSKPVALRDESALSVILGVFRNRGFGQVVTLAQVFWFKDAGGQPARLYVGAETDLSIGQHFTGFGADLTALRRRLRTLGAELHDSFPPYGAWFRRRLGIRSEQALELFHQTVSMKSVGNLTDFVREHMLDPGNPAERIEALLRHFEDLNEAHEAVLRAKRQMALLTPLVDSCDRHAGEQRARDGHVATRDALDTCFAAIECDLIDGQLAAVGAARAGREAQRAQRLERRATLAERVEQLKASVGANGGDRLAQIEQQLKHLQTERDRRKERADEYAALCRDVGIPVATRADEFVGSFERLAGRRREVLDRQAELDNELTERGVELKEGRRQIELLDAELQSLRSRTSNIPSQQVTVRALLCEALSLDTADLPFAGELLQVRPDARDWEGAIERVLHSFGLSLLVPDDHYPKVQQWVDDTNLRGRLVYFRVRHEARPSPATLHRDSLVRKVEVAPASPYRAWVARELARRFDYACCATPEQFRRETLALTRKGQVKGGNERHEKDDRTPLDDRSRYVLGWSNADKVAALEDQRALLADRLGQLGAKIVDLQQAAAGLRDTSGQLARLTMVREFAEIDWETPARHIAELADEQARLLAASDVLTELQRDLGEATRALLGLDEQLAKDDQALAEIDARQTQLREQRAEAVETLGQHDAERHLELRPVVDGLLAGIGVDTPALRSLRTYERTLRKQLQDEIDAAGHRIERLTQGIVRRMQELRHGFPAETAELDASLDAAGEYRALLDRLAADDLPRHEARFKQLLNENTIREIANFQSQLTRQVEDIWDRIDEINASLLQIDYNPGRYITLELATTDDPEVREFRADLRACTEGALTGADDPAEVEARFLQVRAVIERFQGRDGAAEVDRRWTTKVTDVRNWFTFAASERYRDDGTEHEHYSDSSGKSGGQKEKLAYTVLAASLAYQFGLEAGEVRSQSFRFVVIDEAFGRGSDESARFGLELFAKLNLQVLVITPLQKIHVIEPFVRNVGFVHNESGEESRLRTLTIEEYHHERRTRAAAHAP